MKATIVGILKSVTKNGAEATTLHYTHDMSGYQRENQHGEGLLAESVYTTIALPAIKVGDKVDMLYEPGFQGKATLTAVNVIK